MALDQDMTMAGLYRVAYKAAREALADLAAESSKLVQALDNMGSDDPNAWADVTFHAEQTRAMLLAQYQLMDGLTESITRAVSEVIADLEHDHNLPPAALPPADMFGDPDDKNH